MRAELVCADVAGLLMEYMEDVLPPAEREALDAHVARCPRCVAFLKSYRATPRILRDATVPALPAGLGERLRLLLRNRLRNPPA